MFELGLSYFVMTFLGMASGYVIGFIRGFVRGQLAERYWSTLHRAAFEDKLTQADLIERKNGFTRIYK